MRTSMLTPLSLPPYNMFQYGDENFSSPLSGNKRMGGGGGRNEKKASISSYFFSILGAYGLKFSPSSSSSSERETRWIEVFFLLFSKFKSRRRSLSPSFLSPEAIWRRGREGICPKKRVKKGFVQSILHCIPLFANF